MTVARDIQTEAERLAADPRLTDYDFWQTLKTVDDEIHRIVRTRRPIPIEILRWRRILKFARSKRKGLK